MVCPNSTPLWESSTNRSNSQGGNPSYNTASQEVSTVHPNSTPSQEDGANCTNSLGGNAPSPHVVNNTRSHAVRCSARLRASQADSAIPQANSEVSQASRASPLNSTTSQATSSAGSQDAVALPTVSNNITQAGSSSGRSFHRDNRCSARLRASQSSQADSAIPQADSKVAPGKWGLPSQQQATSSFFPRKQWLSPPVSNNITQAGSSSGRSFPRGNRHSTRLRASQASQGDTATSQANSITPQGGNDPPLYTTLGLSPQGYPMEGSNPKWVINLSSKPLTQAQRADINRVLRSSLSPKPNLTKAQSIALRDRDHIVLTADKGVAMVIKDRQDYINKANALLNQNTYRAIPRTPLMASKTN